MSDEDNWPFLWSRRSWWPLSNRWMFEEMQDFFAQMEEHMRKEFEDLLRRAPKDLIRTKTLPDGTKVSEWGPFVFGYSVTFNREGKPQIRQLGNVKPKMGGGKFSVDIEEKREPFTDIVTTENEVKVIAELPGAEKRDIKLYATEDRLSISVDKPQCKYSKEMKLPAKVDVKRASSSYKNGVLEVNLPIKNEGKPEGEPIRVD